MEGGFYTQQASEITPYERRTEMLMGLKFDNMRRSLPSAPLSAVSVNFCIQSVMNFVAIEDAGFVRERVTEIIA
jgi:hypothetical protein